MRRRWLFALLPLPLIFTACTGGAPQRAVAEYGRAVQDNDPEAAWERLDPALREELDRDRFLAEWADIRREVLPLADDMADAESASAKVRAHLQYSEYDRVQLRLTSSGWRITGGVLDLYSQATPRDALRSFVRALDHRRYDVLMRFIPSEYARHMTPEDLQRDFQARADEIEELTAALKLALDSPIQERGNQAMLRYGDRELLMVREGDVWKVEDPD